jgi:hypothetical protein
LTTRENVIAGLGLSGRHRKTAADPHSLAPDIAPLALDFIWSIPLHIPDLTA